MPEMPEKREKPESVTAIRAAEKRRSSAAVRCGACHSNVASGEEELASLQSTTATSSCFVGLVEKRGTSGGSVRERGVASIKFPVVEGKRRNEEAISAGER